MNELRARYTILRTNTHQLMISSYAVVVYRVRRRPEPVNDRKTCSPRSVLLACNLHFMCMVKKLILCGSLLACLSLTQPTLATNGLHIGGVKFGMTALSVSAEFDYCDKQDENGEILIKGCEDNAREPYVEVRLDGDANEVIAVTLEQSFDSDPKWEKLQQQLIAQYGQPDETYSKAMNTPNTDGFREYLCYGHCSEKAKLQSNGVGLHIMFQHLKSNDDGDEKNRLTMELIDKPRSKALDKKIRKALRSQ